LQEQFEEHLGKRTIAKALHGVYTKWLRYYLDFCQKYSSPPSQGQSLPQFIQKLQEKKQTKAQQEQVATAIRLYYEILPAKSPSNAERLVQRSSPLRYAGFPEKERFSISERISARSA